MKYKDTPQPRPKYGFETMQVDEVRNFPLSLSPLNAAYAYGRRNGKKFCGAQVLGTDGVPLMAIRRYK